MNWKRYKDNICVIFIFAATILAASSLSASSTNSIHLIFLNDDTINPVTAQYIIKAIDRAEVEDAQAIIIQLDTPGGLLTSTRTIVKRMLTSKVPIIVYIAPAGSRAGSAGVFITYASHVAAMAPSTNIGAAHPVNIGGSKSPGRQQDWEELKKSIQGIKDMQEKKDNKDNKELSETKDNKERPETKGDIKHYSHPMESKILNDTIAFIKAIAKTRNRNIEWGVKSVAESSSITSDEAFKNNVIEILADNLDELLLQLDGRKIIINDQEMILNTSNARIIEYPMDSRQMFFNILANPNIAYFLLILGFYGLLFEVTHPGFSVPGILGAIFLILAFYSMQTLPTNFAGLALIFLALCLFISEAYVPGFGLLTLGGIICLVLGSMLLFDSADPVMRVSQSIIWSIALFTGGMMFFIVGFLLKVRNRKAIVGKVAMIGLHGEVKVNITAEKSGQVFVHGELWKGESKEKLKKGDKIIVQSIEGLTLSVNRLEN